VKQAYYILPVGAADYLAEKYFDQEICSPLRDFRNRNNPAGPSLFPRHSAIT
jgi:hypothetical protein